MRSHGMDLSYHQLITRFLKTRFVKHRIHEGKWNEDRLVLPIFIQMI